MNTYFRELFAIMDSLAEENLEKAHQAIRATLATHNRIYTIGNGGSASSAVHFASDLNKTTISDYAPDAPRLRAESLAGNISVLTAWANDRAYEDVFKEQLVNLLNQGDIVFAISGSGNSPNIIKAVEFANERKATTIGLAGFEGGKLAKLSAIPVVCRSTNMLQIEDAHSMICHYLTFLMMQDMKRS